MFRKLRIKMTLFCIFIISLILLSMTAVLLFLLHQNEELTSFQDFEETVSELYQDFTGEVALSHSWLDEVCSSNDLIVSILDNGEPLLYRQNQIDTDMELLFAQARETALNEYAVSELSVADGSSLVHKEFQMNKSSEGEGIRKSCQASVAYISTNYSVLCITAIRFPVSQNICTNTLYRSVILTTLCAILLLSLLSFFLIRYLVHPLEEGHKRQINFFADASHELRSPLAVLISSLSAMESCPSQEKEFLQTIKKESLRMQRLVNDMFTLASLDNGKIAIHKTEVCLYTLFLEAYEKFEAAAIHKHIFLEISIPLESARAPYGAPASSVTPFKIAARWASPKESDATAYCDPERLTQVFTILFDNAVSYTPEGGHILASILESHNKFIITVSDSGPGIPDEAKEKVFSRFYRYDQSRTDKNHFGLGLSIAKEIIELHEGTITVQDSAEEGAKFIVVLPANTN